LGARKHRERITLKRRLREDVDDAIFEIHELTYLP